MMSECFITDAMLDELRERVRGRMSEKRYVHTCAVERMVARLGELYCPALLPELRVAALLHDITKNKTDIEQLQLCEKFGIMLTATEKESPLIWHQITGAEYVKQELEINDEDIISSIRYHTTGKPNMSLSEKIIFTADLISADRNYPDIKEIRAAADRSLEECIIKVLQFTIADIVSKGNPLHPDTLNAYNYLLLEKKGIPYGSI
jgi:nicotinate-nucleotide adenylyltransferase